MGKNKEERESQGEVIDITEVDTVSARPIVYLRHHQDPVDSIKIKSGRRVIDIVGINWPSSTPEECTDYSPSGKWYKAKDTGIEYLLCQGCGLDCT